MDRTVKAKQFQGVSFLGVGTIWVGAIVLMLAGRALAESTPMIPAVRRVILYSTGIGYFEHDVEVKETQEVELPFAIEDIDDVLRSLTTIDSGGGRVAAVSYPALTLESETPETTIDLHSVSTLAAALVQLKGKEVEVLGEKTFRGHLLGVEILHEKGIHGENSDVEHLTLLTNEGFVRVPFTAIKSIQPTDVDVRTLLKKQLAETAASRRLSPCILRLRCEGTGTRNIRFSYIRSVPVWKVTHRLVMGATESVLQSWAIVENTGEVPWKGVLLELVHGQPTSFRMSVYPPFLVDRPVVAPQLVEGAIALNHEANEATYAEGFAPGPMNHPYGAKVPGNFIEGSRLGGGGFGGGGRVPPQRSLERSLAGPMSSPPTTQIDDKPPEAMFYERARRIAGSVTPEVTGADIGELRRMKLDIPVSIDPGKASMLPLFNQTLPCERVALYSPRASSTMALAAVRVQNTSQTFLKGGPVSVYDMDIYAGDGQIADLSPSQSRWVSFGGDPSIRVSEVEHTDRGRAKSAKQDGHVVVVTHEDEDTRVFEIRNSSDQKKACILEFAKIAEWKPTGDIKPSEETPSTERYAVDVAGKTKLTVGIQHRRSRKSRVDLSSLDLGGVKQLLDAVELDDSARKSLTRLHELLMLAQSAKMTMKQLTASITDITLQQSRIRENMNAIKEKSSDLYNQYLVKLARQEDEYDTVTQQIREANQRQSAVTDELNELCTANTTVEGPPIEAAIDANENLEDVLDDENPFDGS